MRERTARWIGGGMALATIVSTLQAPAARAAGDAPAAAATIVRELMRQAEAGRAGRELRVLTVEYPPGGSSPPHRHNAQVVVYVLEGRVRMQVAGAPAVTLGPGETFYEGPDDVHTVSANASLTQPARIVVFMLKAADAPISSAPVAGARP